MDTTPTQAPSHPLVKLALIAVETYVREHRIIRAPAPLGEDLRQRCGLFVSLITDGQLRGSLGTLRPLQPTAANEVIVNAIGAAMRDPRFTPITSVELPGLHYVVDMVEDLAPLASIADLDPAAEGLVVRAGRRAGVVLPHSQGIETAEQQLGLALRKADLDPAQPYQMQRFCVRRLL